MYHSKRLKNKYNPFLPSIKKLPRLKQRFTIKYHKLPSYKIKLKQGYTNNTKKIY